MVKRRLQRWSPFCTMFSRDRVESFVMMHQSQFVCQRDPPTSIQIARRWPSVGILQLGNRYRPIVDTARHDSGVLSRIKYPWEFGLSIRAVFRSAEFSVCVCVCVCISGQFTSYLLNSDLVHEWLGYQLNMGVVCRPMVLWLFQFFNVLLHALKNVGSS